MIASASSTRPSSSPTGERASRHSTLAKPAKIVSSGSTGGADVVGDDNLEHRREATGQTTLGQAHANLPCPDHLAIISAVNQLARIPTGHDVIHRRHDHDRTWPSRNTLPTPWPRFAKPTPRRKPDYTATLKSEPNNANLYQQRGVVRFFQLKFTESLADFDKFIEMTPSREPYHWQRGLVHYYAGKYEARPQTVRVTPDRQHAGRRECRVALPLRFKNRRREGGGKTVHQNHLRPARAAKGNPRALRRQRHRTTSTGCHQAGDPTPAALARNQFYGHLYLGLYFEAQGNAKKAAEYIAKAAEGYEAHSYMGQVARVHHEWLQQKVKNKEVKPEK